MTSRDTVLRVAGISKRFGGLQALSEVGITIERGQVYGLIGPNGAGKTTFFNVITGLYTPDSGSFELAGKPYKPSAVHEVAKAGIARTFQNIRLFAEMTALENVMVGRHIRSHSGLLGAIFRTSAFKAEEAAIAVGAVAYHASQPWPFPASLMIGCLADALTDEVTIDHDELEDARWFTRDEVRAMLSGAHPDGLIAPPPIAIAHALMKAWCERG